MSGEIIIFIIKFMGLTAMLWVIYLMLFKTKASFKAQRVYLLLIPIIATVTSTLSFEYIEIAKTETIENIINTTQIISDNFLIEDTNSNKSVMNNETQNFQKKEIPFNFKTILYLTYIVVSLIMLTLLLIGIIKINNFKKIATKQTLNDIDIYRCGLIETPFSFWRSIFIDRKINGEKLDLVIKHELEHINSLHFIDKLIIEIYIIIFWYNPFIWSIRREIGLVHEFESDSKVITKNCNIKSYKKFLFEEVVYSAPTIANGFNNSLIKQRFIQMKNNYQIRYKTARRLFTIPLIGCLMALTSFTYIKEDVVSDKIETSIDNITEYINQTHDSDITISKNEVLTDSNNNIEKQFIQINTTDTIISDKNIAINQIKSDSSIKIIDTTENETKNKRIELPWYKHPMCYELNTNQYTIYPKKTSMFKRNKAWVYRRKEHTQVDILCNIYNKIGWVIISSNFSLVDTETGEKYMVQYIKNDVPFDKTLIIRDLERQTILFSLIFPLLDEKTKRVNIVELLNSESFVPDSQKNGNILINGKTTTYGWKIDDVKVHSEKTQSFNQ